MQVCVLHRRGAGHVQLQLAVSCRAARAARPRARAAGPGSIVAVASIAIVRQRAILFLGLVRP
eukprot:SAG22_NODE_386_length_11304_cov_3.084694_4_plen_63_part_00